MGGVEGNQGVWGGETKRQVSIETVRDISTSGEVPPPRHEPHIFDRRSVY